MTDRENYLRTIEFRNPKWIPCGVGLSAATWHKHREKLEGLVLRHPLIFKGDERGSRDFDNFPSRYRQGEYFRDNWGCLWYNVQGGLEGQVVEHPLADWKALDSYRIPDPLKECDSSLGEPGKPNWKEIRKRIEERKRKGFVAAGNGGRLFDRLYLLRGFERLMIDFATDAPQLPRLIDMLLDYGMRLIGKWLEIGVDQMNFHTDIGTQNSLMISPGKFRRYLKSMFKEMFTTCRKAGTHVFLSSDGHLLEIVDDLIECGVSAHDPQLRANTLEGIERVYKGKICIALDLDRQVFPFCKPGDIQKQVKDVVEKLGSPEGGLTVFGSVSAGDVPLENIEALCKSLEDYCLMEK